MIRTVALARVEADCEWAEGLRYSLDDARVAAALTAVGLGVRLYAGQPFGRVQDLARQLARLRSDALLLWVEPATVDLSTQLGEALLELRPGTRLLWWGHHGLDADPPNGVHLLPAAQVEAVPAALNRMGLIDHLPPAPLPSPYLTGTLAAGDLLRLGLTADQEPSVFASELDWLARQTSTGAEQVSVLANEVPPAKLSQVLDALRRVNLPVSIALHTNLESLSADLLSQLTAAKVRKLVVYAAERSELAPSVQAQGVAVEWKETTLEYGNKRRAYVSNGLSAFYSGIYPDLTQGAGLIHLEAPLTRDPEDRRAGYQWARKHLRHRNAAILTGPEPRVRDHLPESLAPSPRETAGWPSRVYGVGSDSAGHGTVFADGHPIHPIQFTPFAEPLNRIAADKDVLTVRTLHRPADLEALEVQLHRFHAQGLIEIPAPHVKTITENMCRWTRYGTCSALQLRRLALDDGQHLSACRDAGPIGEMGSTYEDLLTRQKQEQQLAEVRRGCSTCPVRDECSHCFHLPDLLSDRYCDIRRAYPQASLFFELQSIVPFLARAVTAEGNSVHLQVSCTGLPNRHYPGPCGDPPGGRRPVLLSQGSTIVAWHRGTTSFSRMSPALSIMLEGWWTGSADKDITQALCARFSVAEEQAGSALHEGLTKLKAGGLLGA